jgi:hypothetical protein
MGPYAPEDDKLASGHTQGESDSMQGGWSLVHEENRRHLHGCQEVADVSWRQVVRVWPVETGLQD